MTNQWIDVGPQEQFAVGTKTCVTAKDEEVVVCHVEGRLAAVSNICPHARQPLIDGHLDGRVLTCIYHNHAYDVVTGKDVDCPDDYASARTYPVRVTEAGRVQIDVSED